MTQGGKKLHPEKKVEMIIRAHQTIELVELDTFCSGGMRMRGPQEKLEAKYWIAHVDKNLEILEKC